jgi:1,4-alpha-glucan branching enzyme
MSPPTSTPEPRLGQSDIWLFNEGNHTRLYEKLGAHVLARGGVSFAVWAPNAQHVSAIGDWNGWTSRVDELEPVGSSGLWHGVVAAAEVGHHYKYRIESRAHGYVVDKADPFAFQSEQPPHTASVVCRLDHEWGDAAWMAERGRHNAVDAPMSVYELHLGSWRHAHVPGELRSLNYREVAEPLADHVQRMGFTHVELLPVMEHPFYASWGYQSTGYFAPTSRFGPPTDFMELVDVLHQRGIGVLLDWVPSHFPSDEHGLGFFDGTHLYEHADPRKGLHPDWDSLIFNYDRFEVRSFLLSSARFWLDRYHADGLRVDAVASMLYLDYSRRAGEWIPNEHGGNENLGALRFLKILNEQVYADFPDVQTVAEESTAWPMVSRPTSVGGLGFGLKWDMGWMHDTLRYLERDPIHRRHHHGELTFRMIYAFNENFVLPLSHDEVVHGKGSLLAKMPGDRWQRFANLRLLYGYQWGQPGKKLLFMGGELAQPGEWNHDAELAWGVLGEADHEGVRRWVARLNHLHRSEPALHAGDCDPDGFRWVVADDADTSVLAFLRRTSPGTGRDVLVVANFTPVPRPGYRVGVPVAGRWVELANSDGTEFGGGGVGNSGGCQSEPVPAQGWDHSVVVAVPPLAVVFLAPAEG